jgi:hypothetical protein
MADFTITLKELVEAGVDVGLRNYPIFEEDYRGALNQMILDRYWFHEIGFTTKAKFIHFLNAAMNENMPYYNEFYKSAALILNPLQNQNASRVSSGEVTSENSQESANENESENVQDLLNVESTTPKSLLSVSDIKTNVYASLANRQDNTANTTDSGTASSSGSSSGTHEATDVLTGYEGQSISSLISDFRATLVNINKMVLDSLSSCFMNVYEILSDEDMEYQD